MLVVIGKCFVCFFHNLHYAGASDIAINDNTIVGQLNVPFPADPTEGIVISSIQSAVASTVNNNTVIGTTNGFVLWNLPTTTTVTVRGGVLSSNQVGILADNFDDSFGNGDASRVAADGVLIKKATAAGIHVRGVDGINPMTLEGSHLTITDSKAARETTSPRWNSGAGGVLRSRCRHDERAGGDFVAGQQIIPPRELTAVSAQ